MGSILLSMGLRGILCSTAFSQTGIEVSQMQNCDNLVETFMTTYGIPGATFALAKNGKLIY